ncbi:MAG: methionyl-tRNA formyltransferase-like protein [Nitrospirae bacterium]|nr:methionyl-tRNA formyltransferase-like protein [Nitrospirota bacterium]
MHDMNQELNKLEDMIAAASSQIEAEYFQLPVADADTVYRERVYCYELYHQLRCLWKSFPFSLGGEIDKAGHPHFKDGPYAQAKPDLLVHVPRDMTRNLACIEVKPFGRPVAEFTSDLEKLTWFCRHAKYYRGVFLIYGDLADTASGATLRDKVQKASEHTKEIDLALIYVLHHPAIRQKAGRVGL